MKERFRKQKFLKNFGLVPNKNTSTTIESEYGINICERLCFYDFDDNEQVICRGCYKSFKTWLDFRIHFNTISCHITDTNYKLNSYNDVYKKYKLRKAKTKKRINDRLSAAQLMDIETLNTRKTRKRCYVNTRTVVNNISKSSSDSGSSNSEKVPFKTENKEDIANSISSDESLEEVKPKTMSTNTVNEDIPESTKTNIPKLDHDNQLMPNIKAEWNPDDVSLVSSDDQLSDSANCLLKNKVIKYSYVCVVCDEQFSSKCLLTMHQVHHIKSDRSSYGVFMAALARSA